MLSSHPWLVPFATQADPGMYTPGQAHSFARSLAPSPLEGKARASISLALSDPCTVWRGAVTSSLDYQTGPSPIAFEKPSLKDHPC